jgi:hypothetical protein
MDDLTEGSILDLNEEWKPIGLVKKHQKTQPFTITIFFFFLASFYFVVYKILTSLYDF